MTDTKKLIDEIERLDNEYKSLSQNDPEEKYQLGNSLMTRAGHLFINNLDTILAALRTMEALPISELEEAGMNLSKYTAAINWRPGDNTQEWLNDLHRRISTVQALYSARAAALASRPAPKVKV